MSRSRKSLPIWAITNTVLLFAPIILGIGAFRIWFAPNPGFRIPALVALIVYYIVVYNICGLTSRTKLWPTYQKTNSGWRSHLWLTFGFVMFSFVAFQGFYTVGPGLLTRFIGNEAIKELTVESTAAVYRRHCRYEIRFRGVLPALGDGFCMRADQFDGTWSRGSKVNVYGYESVFGFKIMRIGPNKSFNGMPIRGTP
ncbi:MAG: hypothetical protein V7751_18980 [Pseudoalteromonas distincta]